jgi:hypothetical protein
MVHQPDTRGAAACVGRTAEERKATQEARTRHGWRRAHECIDSTAQRRRRERTLRVEDPEDVEGGQRVGHNEVVDLGVHARGFVACIEQREQRLTEAKAETAAVAET